MRIERDIRYLSARLKSAILINPLTQNNEIVLFSARVEVLTGSNKKKYFEIVGEDEVNIKENKISYLSPLAKLLIGNRVDDEVVWNKPSGNEILTITNIYYCGQTNPHHF
jgi:transcription elongation GreA/GreB family factor